MTEPIRIVKMGYSSAPWRLLSGDMQLTVSQRINHAQLGETSVVMPMCFDTKADAINGLGNLAAQLLDERNRLIVQIAELAVS